MDGLSFHGNLSYLILGDLPLISTKLEMKYAAPSAFEF